MPTDSTCPSLSCPRFLSLFCTDAPVAREEQELTALLTDDVDMAGIYGESDDEEEDVAPAASTEPEPAAQPTATTRQAAATSTDRHTARSRSPPAPRNRGSPGAAGGSAGSGSGSGNTSATGGESKRSTLGGFRGASASCEGWHQEGGQEDKWKQRKQISFLYSFWHWGKECR